VGSTPCATTTVPTGPPQARETAWEVAARAIRTSNRSHDIGVSPSYPWLCQSGASAGSASSDGAYRGRTPVMVPESGVGSLDHFIRAEQHRRRDCHTERPRGLEIDDNLALRRLFDGQVSRPRAFEDPVHRSRRVGTSR